MFKNMPLGLGLVWKCAPSNERCFTDVIPLGGYMFFGKRLYRCVQIERAGYGTVTRYFVVPAA